MGGLGRFCRPKGVHGGFSVMVVVGVGDGVGIWLDTFFGRSARLVSIENIGENQLDEINLFSPE